jgi:hypothetical protein
VSNSSNDPVDVELTYTEQELYCAARWLTRVWRGNLFYALLTDLFHCSQPSSMCRHRVFACCACGLRRREASQEDSGDFGRAPCTPERDCGRATTDSNIASAPMGEGRNWPVSALCATAQSQGWCGLRCGLAHDERG